MSQPLDPAHTCLLLFDFLAGYVNGDPERFRPVVQNAAALLAAARSAGAMVAHAHADHRPDLGTTARTLRDTDNRLQPVGPESHKPAILGGTPEAKIVQELAPRPGEFLIPKHRWSAFHGTYLETALRRRAADTIVLCGGSTDVGIAATAFAARDLDYNLVISSDACTSPEQDNHQQFMKRVFPRMARVRTTREIVEMLKR